MDMRALGCVMAELLFQAEIQQGMIEEVCELRALLWGSLIWSVLQNRGSIGGWACGADRRVGFFPEERLTTVEALEDRGSASKDPSNHDFV